MVRLDVQRTVRLKLNSTPEQDVSLQYTSDLFTQAFNDVCRVGWDAGEKNGVSLHHLTYRKLKTRFPFLVSDLHIQARMKATEAVKSALTLKRQGRTVGCPRSNACPPRYNVHTFKMNWAAGTARLSTASGKVSVLFTLPDYFKPMTAGKVCTADLIHKADGWWLHVIVDLPAPEVDPNGQSIGVDLGVNRPAVTSNFKFLGKRQWKNVEARYFRQKRSCQSKGTKSAKRKLRQARGKQARFRRDCDHVLSRQIVDAVTPGGTIVLENLTDIRARMKGRQRQRRRLHSWSFAQVKAFVTYKAEAVGSRVELIDPRNASKCCSSCGHIHASNRRSQSLFKCRQCGYSLNADLNGAINIRAKHLGSFGMSLTARPTSTGPTEPQCSNAGAPPPASRRL